MAPVTTPNRRNRARSLAFFTGITAGVFALAFAGYTPKPRPYTIFEPTLPCEYAQQLAHRVVERLGYSASPLPQTKNTQTVIKGQRDGVLGPETVSVTISCGADGVHVDAEADTPPCEQANHIVHRTVARLGYTITSFTPASVNGKRGIIKGQRKDQHEHDTVTLTITCDTDAVYVDTRSDSPVVASADFTSAITDFRRGFFAVFKPLAAEAQRTLEESP
jgi:hypothetical protein